MPTTDPQAQLVPRGLLATLLGLPAAPAAGSNEWFDLAADAATSYVTDRLGERETWSASQRLGAVKLAAGLYRDQASVGLAEAFSDANIRRRATDVEIEQLLRIGRYQLPGVG